MLVASLASEHEIAHPDRLGPYRILARINRGGTGVVYRGRDDMLGREVTIRVLPPDFARWPELVQRFEAEAAALTGTPHPNIVPVCSIGKEQQWHYLVTPLYDGGTLAERLAQSPPLPMAEVVAILEQCLHALSAAHAKQLVHGDLKPANVLLDRQTGRALVADFGLASTLAQPADARADLHALGVVAYQMLSGRLPFSLPAPDDTLSQHTGERASPLLEAAPQTQTPPPLAALVERLVDGNPQQRPAAAEALAELRHLRATGVVPPSQSVAARMRPRAIPTLPAELRRPLALPVDWEYAAEARDGGGPSAGAHMEKQVWHIVHAVAARERYRGELTQAIAAAECAQTEVREQHEVYRQVNDEAAAQRAASPADRQAELRALQARCVAEAGQLCELDVQIQPQLAELQQLLAKEDAELPMRRGERDQAIARFKAVRQRPVVRRAPRFTSNEVIGICAAVAVLAIVVVGILVSSPTKPNNNPPILAGPNYPFYPEDRSPSKRLPDEPIDYVPPDNDPPNNDSPEDGGSWIRTGRPTQITPFEEPPPKPAPPPATNFVPDEALQKLIDESPLRITGFEPQTAIPGDEVKIFGRGFAKTERVGFATVQMPPKYSMRMENVLRVIDRAADFRVVSDIELRVRVPYELADGAYAYLIVVTPDGVTVTTPSNIVVIDETFRPYGDAKNRMFERRGFSVVERGFKDHFSCVSFVRPGGMSDGRLDFVQAKGYGGEGFRYYEPGAIVQKGFADKWAVKAVVPSPVPKEFSYKWPARPPWPADGLPRITSFSPPAVSCGETFKLTGSGFAGAMAVFVVEVPTDLYDAARAGLQHEGSAWEQRDAHRCNMRVVSDTEIWAEAPFLRLDGNGMALLPIVLTPNGVTYAEPPDVKHLQGEPDGLVKHVVTVLDSGAVAKVAGRVVTVVENDAVFAAERNSTVFVKKGGRISQNGGGNCMFWEKDIDASRQREPKNDRHWYEVPAIVASPLASLPEFAPRYPIMPLQATPVAETVDALTFKKEDRFARAFAKSVQSRLEHDARRKLFETHRDRWLKAIGIDKFPERRTLWLRFLYTGDDREGVVRIDHDQKRLPFSIRVILEDGRWVLADAELEGS